MIKNIGKSHILFCFFIFFQQDKSENNKIKMWDMDCRLFENKQFVMKNMSIMIQK
jgi:hypothetical protein